MSALPEVMPFLFDDAGTIPNHRSLPLLVYKRAIAQRPGDVDPAAAFEAIFSRHGWRPAWRWGVYRFPHYHSTAHEVLGVYRGHATLRLGDRTGITIVAETGDVIVIPAGVGHENLGSSADFHVAGGYPEGQRPDLLRGEPGERPAADRAISRVPLPGSDPVSGRDGPLAGAWKLVG